MALFADLHRHLGGAVVPRILWRFLQRSQSEIIDRFAHYGVFEQFYTAPTASLA